MYILRYYPSVQISLLIEGFFSGEAALHKMLQDNFYFYNTFTKQLVESA